MSILLLAAGLVLLVIAGDALVRGSVASARRLHIPPIVIGLTVVAFGTSAPELIVSMEAALAGAPGLAIGNAVGSNISNSLLVLGLPAVFAPILLSERGIRRSAIFMIAVSVLLIALGWDGRISQLDGLILFTLLVLYLTYSGIVASSARSHSLRAAAAEEAEPEETLSVPKTLALLAFGIVGLAFGGKLTTVGALGVAEMFGLADSAVGLTIVALGTSLPELAAGLAAAFHRQTGVVIGNVIGSNIFNILGILGLTAMLVPLHIAPSILHFDVWIMIAAALAMVPIAFTTRRINRYEGALMTLAYIAYVIVALRTGVAH